MEDQLSWESTCLTSRGSAVRARHPPPFICADLAQLVEQLTCNQQVVGSIPIVGTIYDSVAQAVEQLTFNQWVGCSIHPGVTIINAFINVMCLSGGIGRRTGLKILQYPNTVWVQFPPQAPFLNILNALGPQLSWESACLASRRSTVRSRQDPPFVCCLRWELMAVQLSWLERTVHTREVGGSNPSTATISRTRSSVGQSHRLITGRSQVRVLPGPPSLLIYIEEY